jgi:type 1 fimbria pilin
MLKKSLFVAAAVAMLAVSAQAGEIKVHTWPTTFVPQEICTIPVVMDVGYWIVVKDQSKNKITLTQVDIKNFSGCTDIKVENNFALTLTCTIGRDGPVDGKFSCDFGPGVSALDLDPGANTVKVCAYLTDADMKNSNPKENVKVANVKVWVVPRA